MKNVSESLHLVRRPNGVWYYRRRVPDVAVAAFGKRILQFSLKTENKQKAIKLRELEDLKFSARLEEIAAGKITSSASDQRRRLSGPTARRLVQDYVERMDREFQRRHDGNPPDTRNEKREMQTEAEIDVEILRDPEDERSAEFVSLTRNKILADAELSLEDSTIPDCEFAELIRRGLLELYRRRAARLKDSFWSKHLKGNGRRLMFIVGAGFDPRVIGSAEEIIACAPNVARKCVAIDMSEGYDTDEAASDLGAQNLEGLHALFPGDALEIRSLTTTDTDGIRDVSRSATVLFDDFDTWIGNYTDIIVDISALPRLVYLTILNTLLNYLVDPNAVAPLGSAINLHVVYAESATIDTAINKYEIETDLAPIHSLAIRLDEEASLNWPIVWLPVLAEDVLEQLTRISERTNPDEICPVLPVQSADARRGDNIISTLGEFLFDRYDVDIRDILRATEWNPFQLYRNLMLTMDRYEESLKLFGGARFVLSPLSSKGLSIGCLLATFEKRATGNRTGVRVGMAHVESRRYEAAQLSADAKYQLISAWITGECYSVSRQEVAEEAAPDARTGPQPPRPPS